MSLWFVDMNQRVKKPGVVVLGVRVGGGVGHVVFSWHAGRPIPRGRPLRFSLTRPLAAPQDPPAGPIVASRAPEDGVPRRRAPA